MQEVMGLILAQTSICCAILGKSFNLPALVISIFWMCTLINIQVILNVVNIRYSAPYICNHTL